MKNEEYVIKRNGQKESISFDKILTRVKKLGGNDLSVNYTSLVQKIIDRLYDEIPTTKIDELTAQQCASLITTHGDYGELASRILTSNHHKNTPATFYEAMSMLYNFTDINNEPHPLISQELWNIIEKNKHDIENMINYDNYLFAPALIQFTHRMLAYFLVVFTVYMFLKIKDKIENVSKKWLNISLYLVIGQVVLGVLTVLNVHGKIPLFLGVTHQLIGLLYFMSLLFLYYSLRKKMA